MALGGSHSIHNRERAWNGAEAARKPGWPQRDGGGGALRGGGGPWVACPAGEVGTTAGFEHLTTPGVDVALALLTRAVGPEQARP